MSAASTTSGLILVAPVFNEEKIVARFLERVLAVAAAADIRGLVIVDDGSHDETCAAIREYLSRASSPRPKVRLLRLSRNFGHQVAVVAGIQAAVAWAEQAGFAFVGLIDADLQDRPEDLMALLAAVREADVAYGVRASRSEGLMFRVAAATFHWLLARTARFNIPRDAGTFSVMRLRAARVVAAESHQAPYFPALRAWVGFRQVGVPLARDVRVDDSSRVGPLGLLRLAMTALLSFSDLPLSFLVVMATLTILGSICAALLMVGLKLAGLVQVQGTALILISIFLSLGIQSMQLALLAHALGRARAEASRSAGYVVMADEAGL
ncbi:MAG: glycosyltransferase family 2 protein [Vicinamibacteria bacterium]|nr:glycosyltransferase family 2 protein [Vicinamibacteria bacterium]